MSARRPRTSNRRYAKGKEERSTDRDEDGGEKSKQKKRKLSDLLGPPWSEHDLKHFYQSYRRHGRDWKKVAATFQNRTAEMVEVLYSMNKAYLSLPEGTASAAGLIAMMTDHYNILDDSRSLEDESSKDVTVSVPSHHIPVRLRNTALVAQQGNRTGNLVLQASGLSSYGGPSPAKKPRTIAANRPRAVGKRTPRVPLMHLQGKAKSGKLPQVEPVEDAEQDSFGDCDEVKVALTLAASASQRAASPQISRTPACRTDRSRSMATQNGHAKNKAACAGSGSSGTKHTGSNMDDGENGGSEESRDTENGVVTKASTSTAAERRKRILASGEAKSKFKKSQKFQTKRGKMHGFENFRSDELKEECSCTEEGTLKQEDARGIDGFKSDAPKKKRPPSQKTKKRSRQLFSGDERSGLDALATLADLSLNGLLPSPRLDAEGPNMKILELSKDASERVSWTARDDIALHAEPLFGFSKETVNPTAKGPLAGRSKESHCRLDIGSNFDSDLQKGTSVAELRKRKRKGLPDKREQFSDGHIAEPEDRVDSKGANLHAEDSMARTKLKRTVPGQTLIKYPGRPVKQEPDQELDVQDVVVGESEVEHGPTLDIVKIPVKQRSRRKSKSSATSVKAETAYCTHALVAEEKCSNKVRLTHCLSSEKVRRWCIYEWFYSAIDLPWFARNEFVEYLNHAGLGHVPRLTRAEWGVIRGSLGKPRRLSKRFLQEERDKLESYRDSVRKHYQEVRLGQRDGLPTDLPRPLTVGQRVIARHPKTKEVYNGSILTVDRNKCRVQFDRPEMGVELVADIDCMPVNSFENLSDALIRKSILVDGGNRGIEDSKHGAKAWISTSASLAARVSINERQEKPASVPVSSSSSSSLLNALCKQAQAANTVDSVLQVKAAANEAVAAAQQAMFNQPCSLAQVQAKEADIRALADLTRALDKKEAILVELRNMNDDADANQRDGEAVRTLDMFKKQYATLVVQLREVNQQVCGALLQLRQRNKYQENCLPPWHRSSVQHATGYVQPGNLESNAFSLEQFPLAKEVTMQAKHHARLMVNTAVETMLSIKEGEDALSKIGIALNHLPKANMNVSQGDGVKAEIQTAGPVQVSSGFGDGVDWSDGNPVNGAMKPTNGKDTVFLADLMSTCVATLLMVQAFTEKQFPPAEIAMAFDSILASMRPCSSQNYQIYSEIQHYASLLKNQIMALIPTQSLPVDCPPLPH
eukprot:c21731_g1_i1 orf=621-4265(+)